MATCEFTRSVGEWRKRIIRRNNCGSLAQSRSVDIALQSQFVAIRKGPVDPTACAQCLLSIVRRSAQSIYQTDAFEILAVHTIISMLSHTGPVAKAAEASLLRAAARGHQNTLSIFSSLSDDIDYAVDGVGAPESATRAANDFDSFYVFQ
jgi:hypothetical protein